MGSRGRGVWVVAPMRWPRAGGDHAEYAGITRFRPAPEGNVMPVYEMTLSEVRGSSAEDPGAGRRRDEVSMGHRLADGKVYIHP